MKTARLIELILAEEHDGYISVFDRNNHLAKKLSKKGKAVVEPVLDKLFGLKEKGEIEGKFNGAPIFHLISVATKHAGSEHAEKLAQMLLWDEICLDTDRSSRGNILSVLEKVGAEEIIPLLKDYAEKVKLVRYIVEFGESSPEEIHRWDQEKVARAIEACKKRK